MTLPEDASSEQGNKVEHGKDYTFVVKDYDPFYDYTVSAKIGETDAELVDNGNGSYTVKNVTGDLTIGVSKTGKTFDVALDETEVDGAAKATYGDDYSFKLKKPGDDGNTRYDVTVTIDGKDCVPAGPDDQGNYKIDGKDIKGKIEITVTKTPIPPEGYVNVKVDGSGKGDVTAAKTAQKEQNFQFTVAKAEGYAYIAEVSIGAETIKEGSDYLTFVDSEDGPTRTYTLKGEKVVNDILITVKKVREYKVTVTLSDKAYSKYEIVYNAPATALEGETYTFTVSGFKQVYKLIAKATENDTEKTVKIDRGDLSKDSRSDLTCTIEDVRGDLNINLSYVATDEYVEVVVKRFVRLNDKDVYLVLTCPNTSARPSSHWLDTYDGNAMYLVRDMYKSLFAKPNASGARQQHTFAWLVTVEKDESFTVGDALEHLTYTNLRRVDGADTMLPKPDSLGSSADVNSSGKIDVNDAQLVYDIYNGVYQTFCRTNNANGVYVDPQIGLTMTKLFQADVIKDGEVNVKDASAVVDKIK